MLLYRSWNACMRARATEGACVAGRHEGHIHPDLADLRSPCTYVASSSVHAQQRQSLRKSDPTLPAKLFLLAQRMAGEPTYLLRGACVRQRSYSAASLGCASQAA